MGRKRKRVVWLTIPAAAAWVGPRRGGRPTHEYTVRRWCLHGLSGVVLRSELRGNVRYTRPAWIRAFFRELTLARQPDPAALSRPSLTAEERRRAKERQKLIDAGAL